MQSNKKNINLWPYAIVLSIVFVAIMCADVVRIALSNPVEMDSYYLSDYHDVDENINEILKSKKEFDKKYKVEVEFKKFVAKDNKIKIKITDKKDLKNIEDAKIELLITRPDVSTFDKKPKFIGVEDGYYIYKAFDVEKKGRWQILVKVNLDNLVSFTKLETYAVIQ